MLTDEELGHAIAVAWDNASIREHTSPGLYAVMGKKARELLAGSAKPVATDEETGKHIVAAWYKSGATYAGVGRKARELLAEEAKPVEKLLATPENVEGFISGYAGHWSRDDCCSGSKQLELAMAILAHFAPPAPELPPICGMTDDELAVQLHAAYDASISRGEYPGWWLAVARRARELLAGEVKPVATWDTVMEWWLSGEGEELVDPAADGDMGEVILAALAHFAPPAPERATLFGMTALEIMAVLDAKVSVFSTQNCISGRRRILEACARIIHDLAQPVPVPVVDPDAGAKALCWEFHKNEEKIRTPDEAWNYYSPIGQNKWRAVAAAKVEGGV